MEGLLHDATRGRGAESRANRTVQRAAFDAPSRTSCPRRRYRLPLNRSLFKALTNPGQRRQHRGSIQCRTCRRQHSSHRATLLSLLLGQSRDFGPSRNQLIGTNQSAALITSVDQGVLRRRDCEHSSYRHMVLPGASEGSPGNQVPFGQLERLFRPHKIM